MSYLSVCLSQVNEGVAVVSLPNGQPLQVQGVIQSTQPSVIQSPQIQTVQVHTYRFFICNTFEQGWCKYKP